MRRSALFIGFALVASGAACGGSESASATEPGGTGLNGTATNGTFSAQINGANWGAQGTVTVTRGPNNFVGLGASGLLDNTAYSLVLSLANASGPGTYSLNFSPSGGSSLLVGTIKGGGWGTDFSGGTGSVTVTALTSNRIVGTFTADAPPTGGRAATDVLHVRNGRFDISF
jgi:hypothetical protein